MSRVRYPEPFQLPPDVSTALDGLPLPDVIRAMLNSPHLGLAVAQQGIVQFTRLDIPGDLRELLILTVGHHYGCDYVIAHHEPVARSVGCTGEQLQALRLRAAPDGTFTPVQQGAMRLARHIIDRTPVPSGEPADPRAAFSDRELVEITLLTGYYQTICAFCAVIEIDLEPDLDPHALLTRITPPEPVAQPDRRNLGRPRS